MGCYNPPRGFKNTRMLCGTNTNHNVGEKRAYLVTELWSSTPQTKGIHMEMLFGHASY